MAGSASPHGASGRSGPGGDDRGGRSESVDPRERNDRLVRREGRDRSERSAPSRGARAEAQWLLAALEARRTAPFGLGCAVIAVALAAAHAAGIDGALAAGSGIAPLEGFDQGLDVAIGGRHAAAWVGGMLVALPSVAMHAALLASRWRAGDGDWLGARPIGRLAAATSSIAGMALGAALLALAIAAAAMSAGGGATRELHWRAGPDRHVALEPRQSLAESLPDAHVPAGAKLRVRVTNSQGVAPFGSVQLEVARRAPVGAAGVASATVARVIRRTWVEVPAPPGAGPLDVVVTALGPGPLVVVGPSPVELWRPAGDRRIADLRIAGRAATAALAVIGVAAGLGAWLAPPLAALGVLALWILLASLAGGSPALASVLPGADFAGALAVLAEGRMPPPPRVGEGLVAVAAAFLGALLACAALRSWRHAG